MVETEKTNPTIGEICAAYLKAKKDPHGYKRCLVPMSVDYSLRRITRTWGHLTVDEFNKGTIARIEDAFSKWSSEPDPRTKRPIKTGTIRKGLALFRAACQFAVKRELIARNQVPIFDLPPMGVPRERVVDAKKELPAILREAESDSTPYHIWLQTQLLLRLGCRVGALLDLEWKHIDFENRVVLLRETQSAERRLINKKRRENSPMDNGLYKILKKAKKKSNGCTHVISWRGKPIKRSYAGQIAMYKRAGVEGLTRHDLRRTSATYVRDKLGLSKAAEHIGDTVEMTRKHYAHSKPELKLKGIAKVSDVLRAASKG